MSDSVPFEVIPAIDLIGNEVVRLTRGRFETKVVYHTDPPALAAQMAKEGITRLHVVDLEGARDGTTSERDTISDIIKASGLKVQVGGGIRTMETAANYLEGPHAAYWAILGTAALQEPELVREMCNRWPGRVLVGIDARNGRVAVSGWLEESSVTPLALGTTLAHAGVAAIIYTDIGRDGTGHGPNIEATARLAQATGIPVIASGGVANRGHIQAVKQRANDGIVGVVVGRAILSGALTIEAALSA
jgi:phosphoribosylformimino-5-aminoimidazole carboxamide ribotide isomerase